MSHVRQNQQPKPVVEKTANSVDDKKQDNQSVPNHDIDNNISEEVIKPKITEDKPEIVKNEIKDNKVNSVDDNKKIENKDDSDDLDYQQLINDPISIFTNTKLPTKHRIAAIREAGYQKMEKAVPELIKALYDPDTSISLVAAESLGAIGDTRAIDPLLNLTKQNDEELYKAAEEYMGGALALQGEPLSFNVSDKSNDNEEPAPVNYKEMVVMKVEQLPLAYRQPDGCPIPRKDLVIKGLSDSNEQMRQMAAKAAIGIEESTEIIDPLINALTNTSESEAIRAMAAEALGGMSSEKTIDALILALKDDDVAIRYAAAKALSGRSEQKVVYALISATLDSNKFVRASAAYSLGTTGATSALKALIKCAEDENEVVRFSAVKAISTFEFDEVYKRLVEEQLGLERKSQILAKIEILSQFKDSRVIDVLKKYLSDIDSEITYKASMALMAQENPEVIDDIIDASKQLDQELYRLAKDNLDPEAFFEITKFNTVFNGNNSDDNNTSHSDLRNNSKDKTFKKNETYKDSFSSIKDTKNKKKSRKDKNVKKSGSNFEDTLFGIKEEDSVIETSSTTLDKNKVQNNDTSLKNMTGLTGEFEKIRKDLLNDEAGVRVKAANKLGDYKTSKEAIKLLSKSIKDENELVRVATVDSLGRIASTEAFNLILTCEKDMSTEVRYAVVKALAEIPDYSAAEPLKRMASNDISIDVKRNARIALKRFNFI